MSDFIYEKTTAPCGIAVEEIYGADEKSAKVWKLFAMQIFSEADGDYRMIEHFENGAPYLEDIAQRITVSHTSHFLVVASLPKTPDIDLTEVNVRTAIGVDIEKSDRAQVIKIKDKFLTPEETALLSDADPAEDADPDTVKGFILAWTCKEALYKAVMGKAADWKNDYRILSLPKIASSLSEATPEKYGKGEIRLHGESESTIEMTLTSWETEGHVLTLAFSPKIARYPVGQ